MNRRGRIFICLVILVLPKAMPAQPAPKGENTALTVQEAVREADASELAGGDRVVIDRAMLLKGAGQEPAAQ